MAQQNIKVVEKDLDKESLDYYLSKNIIAVDCEMMGLNISRDRLCLVQIGDEKQKITLVKINQGQESASNLKKLLENKNSIKLFHFARTDLAFLKHYLSIEVQNVFCTKIASKLARTYTDKHSLRDLTKEIIGKELKKDQQSSDWGSDQLSADQVKYAANDVYHLVDIYKKLKDILERENKLELAKTCSSFISTFADLDTLGYKEIFEH